jgi:hypothetical protein
LKTVGGSSLYWLSRVNGREPGRRGWSEATMDAQKQPDDEDEDEHDRRATNILLLIAGIVVVGGGIWLVNAMVDARKTQQCFESGRRNCNPISVPDRAKD